MKLLVLAVFLVVAGPKSGLAQDNLEGQMADCMQRTNDINSCLTQFFESLRGYMTTGIPRINIPPTEPFFLPRIEFRLAKTGTSDVKAIFTENEVTGLSNFVIKSIRADRENKMIFADVSVPELVSRGNYALSGSFIVEFEDSFGPYIIKIQDARLKATAKIDAVRDGNGQERLQVIGEPDIDFEVGGLNVRLENLFGGKEGTTQLAELVHNVVNENSQQFINDFKPEIIRQVKGVMEGFFKGALTEITPDFLGL